jgi:transcriptional regulator with XRE-family HTH domain
VGKVLVFDFRVIGNKLLAYRKKAGLTQCEVAEAAGLSDRTYADIERGTVNMRIETILRICKALHITSDAILTEDNYSFSEKREEIITLLDSCSLQEQETALQLLAVYLNSLK